MAESGDYMQASKRHLREHRFANLPIFLVGPACLGRGGLLFTVPSERPTLFPSV